jgi:hypothetical protein
MPEGYWHLSATRARFKVQHELTEQLDTADITEALSLAKDPAVAAQCLLPCLCPSTLVSFRDSFLIHLTTILFHMPLLGIP